MVKGLRALPRVPFPLAAAVLAGLVFGLALLVGWATAGTREPLRHARQVKELARPAVVPVLRQAAALPPAPRTHHAAPAAAPTPPGVQPRITKRGRLIVGQG